MLRLLSNVITLDDLQVVPQKHLPRHGGDERDLPQMTESAPAGDDIIRMSKRYEDSRIMCQTPCKISRGLLLR